MEKHVERMISIVYRAHKIKGKSKDSENKGISSVEGEFYRSICHFARCNYIDTLHRQYLNSIRSKWNEYFLTKKSRTKRGSIRELSFEKPSTFDSTSRIIRKFLLLSQPINFF